MTSANPALTPSPSKDKAATTSFPVELWQSFRHGDCLFGGVIGHRLRVSLLKRTVPSQEHVIVPQMVDTCPRPLVIFWRRPSVEENEDMPEIASLCPDSCVLILHPLEASHSLTTPSSLTLKNEKSSLPIARASLTDPQFIDEFD